MAKILSCVNLKGGVGKTAIAVNVAAYCGRSGHKTLLVDVDPQTNATFSCIDLAEWEKHAEENGTIADLLDTRRHNRAESGQREINSVIYPDVFKNVDLVPSHLDLFSIDLDLAGVTARERKLRKALSPVLDNYDIIICDCPPNLTIPTQNALALSTHYVVPVSPDYLSGIGVGILLSRVTELMEDLEHSLEHIGIIISRVGRPALHREQTEAAIRQRFGDLVLNPAIKERVAVSEAAAYKKPVFESNDHEAVREFTEISMELLKRLGVE